MENILIIRSASFQQLDLNLKAICQKYKGSKIHILTHEHGVKLAEKYSVIDEIYVYPYKAGFKSKNKVKALKDKKFDIVIVPVTNLSGAGFFNVLKYALTIKTDKIVMCNVVSDLKEINKFSIYAMEAKNCLFKFIAIIFTIIFGILSTPFLAVKLKSVKKK